ncbi:MAG: ArnT family glycosyltransferase [Gemmatimonadaceae bacterium]
MSVAPDPRARWGMWAVWCVGALAIVWGAYSLTRPFGFDQGVFAWVGDVLLSGGVPYRDAWDTKGPAAFVLAAAAQGLFGRNEWAIRLLDLAWLAAGVAGVRAIARRLGGGRAAGLTAAALFFLWYASLDYRSTAQPDGWATVLLVWAVLALVGSADGQGGRWWRGAVAGALIGVCALVKPTYGMFLALPLIASLYDAMSAAGGRASGGWRVALAWGVGVAVGFLAPIAGCLAWFAARGALHDFTEVYVVWTATVYAGFEIGWLWRFQLLVTGFLATPLALALPLALVGAAKLWGSDRRAAAVVLAWGVLSVVNLVVQGRFWPYHWIPLYPALAVLTALGVGAAYAASVRAAAPVLPSAGASSDAAGPPSPEDGAILRHLLAASLVAIAVGASVRPLLDVYHWGKLLAGAESAAAYEAREYVISEGYPRDSVVAIGRYVRARTAPGDAVLFWGLDPGVNFLIERRPPGRFALELPLVRGEGSALRAAYRREFMALMTGHAAPAYVVTLAASACPQPDTAVGAACPGLYPDFAALLARDYPVERVIGGFEVRRRRGEGRKGRKGGIERAASGRAE